MITIQVPFKNEKGEGYVEKVLIGYDKDKKPIYRDVCRVLEKSSQAYKDSKRISPEIITKAKKEVLIKQTQDSIIREQAVAKLKEEGKLPVDYTASEETIK